MIVAGHRVNRGSQLVETTSDETDPSIIAQEQRDSEGSERRHAFLLSRPGLRGRPGSVPPCGTSSSSAASGCRVAVWPGVDSVLALFGVSHNHRALRRDTVVGSRAHPPKAGLSQCRVTVAGVPASRSCRSATRGCPDRRVDRRSRAVRLRFPRCSRCPGQPLCRRTCRCNWCRYCYGHPAAPGGVVLR